VIYGFLLVGTVKRGVVMQKGSEISINNKKAFADYCEQLYLNADELSKKQITDRLGAKCRRELRALGINMDKVVIDQVSAWHFELDDDSDASIHTVSKVLGEYRDAIKAIGLKHHNIEANLARAVKHLTEWLPTIGDQLKPDMPLSTLRHNLTKLIKNERRPAVKTVLRDIKIEHHAFYLLQDAFEWSRREATKHDKDNLTAKVANQKRVNPDDIIKVAEALLTENLAAGADADYMALACGLALATGRRRSEIMKTASFQITDTTPANHVMFSGQLKTKDRSKFDDVVPYAIPTLVNPQLVVDSLKLLRKIQHEQGHSVRYDDARGNPVVLLDKHGEPVMAPNKEGVMEPVLDIPVLSKSISDIYHNEAVSANYSSVLNTRFRQIFQNPDLEFRNTRDIYGAVSYPLYKREGEGESVYRTRVYGHAGESQKHYEKFELDTSIRGIATEREQEPATQYHAGLVKALSQFDNEINAYLRSPNVAIIHHWVKEELRKGLSPDVITPSYIRRNCMVNGKMLNFNTIKDYYQSDKEKGVTVNFPALVEQYGKEMANINAGRPKKLQEVDDNEDDAGEDAEQGEMEEAAPVRSAKPKMKAVHGDDDFWHVEINDDVDVFKVDDLSVASHSRTQAMQTAWFKYQAQIVNPWPEKMPTPIINKKGNGDTHVVVKVGDLVVVEWVSKNSNRSQILRYAEQAYEAKRNEYAIKKDA